MKTIEADHFKYYRCPSMLKASPGGKLAFITKQANFATNSYDTNLWQLQNGTAAQLTFGSDISGHWWHGEQLIFAALRTEKDKQQAQQGLPLTVLHALPPEGPGEAQEILRLPYTVGDICFLPGNGFLFVAEYDPATQAIMDVSPDITTALEAFATESCCSVLTELPFWANGEGFTSGKRNRLYLYQNGQITPMVDDSTDVEHLALSQDGSTAFFIATSFVGVRPYSNQIMTLDLETQTLRNLSAEGLYHHGFAVTGPSTLLVRSTDMQLFGIHQNPDFYLLDTSTGAYSLLAEGQAYECEDVVAGDIKLSGEARMQAREEHVYWLTTLNDSAHLMRIHTQSGAIEQLTSHPGCVMEFAFVQNTPYYSALREQAGPELYTLAAEEPETELTALNTAIGEEYAFSEPQKVSFQNKEDETIYGFVMPPANFEEDVLYPAILYIHGGPKAVYGSILQHELQYLAALGFGVLFCNPTGSGGRGNEFADLRGRYGLVDTDDVMGFLQAALAQNPWIDDKRLGIAGGSYGGYLTNWIIGQNNRFAAAVSQRGIANWATMATLSDIGHIFVPDQVGATLLEDADVLWEQSPLKYAGRATTPTLFIHSDEDYRCPVAEGMQMYAALKLANVPTRMCLFHGENHNLSRSGKPQSRLRRLREIAAWFAAYLQPGAGNTAL